MQLLFPGKPADGNTAFAHHGFRPICSMPSEETPMAFVNEVVSDEDIAKYNLPFALGTHCYWTRDSARNLFLWGEISDNPAREYSPEGRFVLFQQSRLLSLVLSRGSGSISFKDDPYRIVWKSIMRVEPTDFAGLDPQIVIGVLKEALSCYGYDGRRNLFAPNRIVLFDF